MKIFTYKDYIKSIHKVRLNSVMKFAEEYAVYGDSKKEQTKENNINTILKDAKEMAKFLNDFLDPRRNISSKELILCSSKLLSKKNKGRETSLVYKIKKTNTYFLVKTIPKVDFKISSKLMSYCVGIIYEANKNIYPSVVPIVIYTGNEKWDLPSNYTKSQKNRYDYSSDYLKNQNDGYDYSSDYTKNQNDGFNYDSEYVKSSKDEFSYSNLNVEMKYNLIQIKNISNQKLLKMNSKFSNYILLERLKKSN